MQQSLTFDNGIYQERCGTSSGKGEFFCVFKGQSSEFWTCISVQPFNVVGLTDSFFHSMCNNKKLAFPLVWVWEPLVLVQLLKALSVSSCFVDQSYMLIYCSFQKVFHADFFQLDIAIERVISVHALDRVCRQQFVAQTLFATNGEFSLSVMLLVEPQGS